MVNDILTEKIINCAYKVYNTLGSGFLESVYQNALLIELENNNLETKPEVELAVEYENKTVGNFRADLIVENKVILELKACECLQKIHEVQLVNYLKATNIEIGLLFNFGPTGLNFKRKYKEYKKSCKS